MTNPNFTQIRGQGRKKNMAQPDAKRRKTSLGATKPAEGGLKGQTIRLRNYVPADEGLKEDLSVAEAPEKVSVEVQEEVEACLDAAVTTSAREIEEDGSGDGAGMEDAGIEVKKIDWDLKRDLSRHMELLDYRTKMACREIMQDDLRRAEQSMQ
eukprot:g1544.t1